MVEVSPISSRTSSPDSQRRSSRQNSISSTVSAGSGLSTPQTTFLQKTKELNASPQAQVQTNTVYSADKPPIPPRGLPPPVPQRQISTNDGVQLRSGKSFWSIILIKSIRKLEIYTIKYHISIVDASISYGNVQARPHSTDYQNNSSNDQNNQQPIKMGKYFMNLYKV